MLGRIKREVLISINKIKNNLKENKILFLAVLISMGIGFFLALIDFEDLDESTNIFCAIEEGEFSFFVFYLKWIFLLMLTYFSVWLLSFNKIAFTCNLFLIILISKIMFDSIISAILCDWTGILLLLFLYLPVIVVNYYVYGLYLSRMSENVFLCRKWTAVYPLSESKKIFFDCLKKYFLKAIIFNLIYSVIFFFIVAIIV